MALDHNPQEEFCDILDNKNSSSLFYTSNMPCSLTKEFIYLNIIYLILFSLIFILPLIFIFFYKKSAGFIYRLKSTRTNRL